MALGEFEIYTHQEFSIVTIEGFLKRKDSIADYFKSDKTDFLNYDGGTGYSNLDRAYSKYTEQEKLDNPKNVGIDLLKMNTEFVIPKSLLNKEVLSFTGQNQFLKQGDFNAFYGQSLLQLLKDPLYRPSTKFRYDANNTLTTIHPFASVWIYVGSLNQILNVTPYLMNLSISVTKQGGNFSFSLPPVVSVDNDDLYEFGDEFYSSNNISRRNKTTIFKNNEIGELGDNNEFYFHKIIQANDIVFIKFEKLEIERKERLEGFILNKSVLAKQFYDMIGLVDENVRSTSFGNNDVTINITGRDFMKLLIDDGSYFFPLLYIENSEETFINTKSVTQDNDRFIKRTFSTGDYDFLYAYSYRGITSTMQFIINQLANLGVVDRNIDLFSSYGKRRTKVYRLDNEGELDKEGELHNGVWQIVKLLADENVADRRVADPSISQPNSSLINQFNKLAQEPFVEFFGDTYGDFYNLVVRQPPYTESQILSVINGTVTDENIIKAQNEGLIIPKSILENNTTDLMISIEPDDVISETLQWDNEQIYSWYEIIPKGAFLGQQSSISLAYIPIVYFPQYANKWGCRRMSKVTNYISYEALTGKDSEFNRDKFKEAIINDYKYMLDSHVYLPFTRKGTIIINGDRRIKRGTWVRNVGTAEIFYVDAVSNSFSISRNTIDRTTTLTVSRGMVEAYTHGDLSYFNIVDTKTISETLIRQLTTAFSAQSKPVTTVKADFGVNQEIFDFFYQRQQFQ